MTCGDGDSAARVIDGTLSPSKKLAFAWRTPGEALEEDPSEIETVLVRLIDGKILAKLKGEYWDTGTMHANRLTEAAAWSPNGHFVIENFHDRYDTLVLGLYALGSDDGAEASLDLLPIVAPASLAYLKQHRKSGRNESYSLSISSPPYMTMSNGGKIVINASLYHPKSDPVIELKIALQIVQHGKTMSARIVSMRPSK